MRRAGLGEGAAGSNYGYTNSGYSVYEEENEKLTESLRSKVTAIKSLSIEIGTEVKQHNKLLTDMTPAGKFTSDDILVSLGQCSCYKCMPIVRRPNFDNVTMGDATTVDNDFDSTSGFLGATMGRLKILSRGSQTKLLCYMMLFSLFVFFVIYWIIKLR